MIREYQHYDITDNDRYTGDLKTAIDAIYTIDRDAGIEITRGIDGENNVTLQIQFLDDFITAEFEGDEFREWRYMATDEQKEYVHQIGGLNKFVRFIYRIGNLQKAVSQVRDEGMQDDL